MQINFNKLLNTRYALKAYLRGYKNNNPILDLDDTFALFLDKTDFEEGLNTIKSPSGSCYTLVSKKNKVLSPDLSSLKWSMVENRVFKSQSLMDSNFLDAFNPGYSFFYKYCEEEDPAEDNVISSAFEEDVLDTNNNIDINDKIFFYRNYVWNNTLFKSDEQFQNGSLYFFINFYLQKSSATLANKLYFTRLHEKKNLVFFRPQTIVFSSSLLPTLEMVFSNSDFYSAFISSNQKLENSLDLKFQVGSLVDDAFTAPSLVEMNSVDLKKVNSLLLALKNSFFISDKVVINFLKLVLLNSALTNKTRLNIAASYLSAAKKNPVVKKPTKQNLLLLIKALSNKKKYS